MLHSDQIELGHKLLSYIDTQQTAMMDTIYHQPITEYTCPEHARQERHRLFHESPLCVGLSGRLPKPDSYFTDATSGIPLLLTRDNDGDVHAFLNVCRHRGAQVATACGQRNTFVCPYHAWTYDSRGALVARPEDAAFSQAPKETLGLTELPAREIHGMIWVGPTRDTQVELTAQLGDLAAELAEYRFGTFHHYDRREIRRRMNWKLVVDTFLESYHFSVLHKNSISSIFYDNLTTFDAWGANFRLVAARRTINSLRDRSPSDWDLMPHIVVIYILFPNTVLVWQGDHIEQWHIYPDRDDPNLALLRVDLYTPEAATSEPAKRHWDRNMELLVRVVEEEDFPLGETIQHGFHSRAQDHILFGCNEPALAHFHRTVTQRVAKHGARLS